MARAEHRADYADLPVIAGDILQPEAAAVLQKPAAERSEAEAELAEEAQARMALVVEEALRMDALTGPIRDRLRGFERIGARRWDVVLDRGQRIMLPEQGAERMLEQVIAMAVTEGVDLLARDLVAVDLRLPRRPTIRMTDAATQEMRRIKAIEAGREVKQ